MPKNYLLLIELDLDQKTPLNEWIEAAMPELKEIFGPKMDKVQLMCRTCGTVANSVLPGRIYPAHDRKCIEAPRRS